MTVVVTLNYFVQCENKKYQNAETENIIYRQNNRPGYFGHKLKVLMRFL